MRRPDAVGKNNFTVYSGGNLNTVEDRTHLNPEVATGASGGSRRGGKVLKLAARLAGVLVVAVAMLAAPAVSSAQMEIGVSVSFGPPALPVYEQPMCPGPGYIWTPGYWAWDPMFGYYWVPGTWVMAPFEGAMWTPGYWDWDDGNYVWYSGYWGPVVGFYGGVNYGYGYTGYGYQGGYWQGRLFYYNRAVNNVSTTNITNVYNRTVINNVNVTRVSYNGGPGGVHAQPTAEQLAAARQKRMEAVDAQKRQIKVARNDPAQRANENKGRPLVAATMRPGELRGRGVVRAERAGAPYKPPSREMMQNQRKMEANPNARPGNPSARPSENNRNERGVMRNERKMEGNPRSMPGNPSARPPRENEPRRAEPAPRRERTIPPSEQTPRARENRNMNRPPAARQPEYGAHQQPRMEQRPPAYEQQRAMQPQRGNSHEARGGEKQHKPPHGSGR